MQLLNNTHNDNNANADTCDSIATLHTNGTGYWSTAVKAVRVTELRVNYINKAHDFGELCVLFNTDDWCAVKDGLIYTDSLFLQELRHLITEMGYAGDDVGYSEQGMQGDNYVSCDVGEEFIASYNAKHADVIAALHAELYDE